jgi:hypothetical protein
MRTPIPLWCDCSRLRQCGLNTTGAGFHSLVQKPTKSLSQLSRCSKMPVPAVLIEVSQQVSKTFTQLRLLLTQVNRCPLPTVPTTPAPKCHGVMPEFCLLDFHCKVTKVHSSQHLYYTSMHKIFRSAHLSPACAHSIPLWCDCYLPPALQKRNGTADYSRLPCRLCSTAMFALVRFSANQLRHSKPPFTVSTDF